MEVTRSSVRIDVPTLAIAATFLLVGLVNLGFPPGPVFDEKYYVPAAIKLANWSSLANREHPMLAKEMLAAWLSALGVSPLTWRLLPLLLGTVSIYAAGATMPDRQSGRILAALLALAFPLFVLSRLAMLEVFCFTFCAFAILAYKRDRLALSGIFFGLAVACKWSAVPVLACFCILYAISNPRKLVRGMVLLGAVPITTYLLTFTPGMFVRDAPLVLADIVPLQRAMLARHEIVEPLHPQASQAWDWIVNRGSMWLEGAGSLELLTGNPVIMLALIPSVLIGLWKRWPESFIYVALMLFWATSDKSNTYYYHYIIPSAFGMGALARLLATRKRTAIFVLASATATFAFCYPALIGHPLPLHQRIWPLPASQMGKLTPEQRERADEVESCMYQPRHCYPRL